MAGINKVILMGNLGKDVEVSYLEGGTAVAKFPLATTESYKDKSGARVEKTEWHNIVLWRHQAEFAGKYLKKGNAVFLEGKLRTRSWEDKDKQKHYTTEIIGENISIVNNSNNARKEGQADLNAHPETNAESNPQPNKSAEQMAGE
jgi:single-strand DNA-binding protein